MRAAGALSTHPVAAIALGEAAGQILDALAGARPALVLVAVTPPHLGTLEDVGSALQALLAPDVVVGAVASAVIAGGRNVEGGPALALFAVAGIAAAPLSIVPEADGTMAQHGSLVEATTAVVLADPFSSRGVATVVAAVVASDDVTLAGGLVGSSGQGPGGSRLLLDGAVRTSGAVGALLGPPARAVASQGWSPTGEPWVVTHSQGDVVLELGGRPAAERRERALGDGEAAALGLLVDEHAEEPGRGNLLAVRIVGPGPGDGLRVARPIPIGQVVRFLRTGPVHVEADLAVALAPHERPSGVLLFPGAGRGGDADLASELLGCPVAGVGVSEPLGVVGRVGGMLGEGATGVVVFP